MFSLSQTTGYAIKALTCLGDGCCACEFISDIADYSGVPPAYLAKIVKRLNDAGLVNSKRGYKGGIWLARSAEKITLLDVSNAIDGEEFMGRCLLGDEWCDDNRDCPTHQFWKKERVEIQKELKEVTVADVAAFEKRKAKCKKAKCKKA